MADMTSSLDPDAPPPGVDPTRPHPARVYDYILGGTNHFPIDREMGEMMLVATGSLEDLRAYARANRDFLGRAVRHLVNEAGIRQFLDIGTGIPSDDNVHGVAQRTAPECRIVYVDNDPIVRAHADVLLDSTAEGAAAFIQGDLCDPRSILLRAAATLDLSEPVAVMLIGVLHLIGDDADPSGIVQRLLEEMPSGSYLALTHMASDVEEEQMAELARTGERVQVTLPFDIALRPREAVARFLEGLELVEPGLVRVDQWRVEAGAGAGEGSGGRAVPLYAAVARKP